MKKIISLVLSTMLLTITILSVSSCTKATTCFDNWPDNRVYYEEKYFYCDMSNNTYYDNIYFVFNRDETGEFHQAIVNANDTSKVSSTIIHFEWRTASDSAIHLFKKSIEYSTNNTDNSITPSLRETRVFASEDFIYNDNHYYVRENSSIFELFSKAK